MVEERRRDQHRQRLRDGEQRPRRRLVPAGVGTRARPPRHPDDDRRDQRDRHDDAPDPQGSVRPRRRTEPVERREPPQPVRERVHGRGPPRLGRHGVAPHRRLSERHERPDDDRHDRGAAPDEPPGGAQPAGREDDDQQDDRGDAGPQLEGERDAGERTREQGCRRRRAEAGSRTPDGTPASRPLEDEQREQQAHGEDGLEERDALRADHGRPDGVQPRTHQHRRGPSPPQQQPDQHRAHDTEQHDPGPPHSERPRVTRPPCQPRERRHRERHPGRVQVEDVAVRKVTVHELHGHRVHRRVVELARGDELPGVEVRPPARQERERRDRDERQARRASHRAIVRAPVVARAAGRGVGVRGLPSGRSFLAASRQARHDRAPLPLAPPLPARSPRVRGRLAVPTRGPSPGEHHPVTFAANTCSRGTSGNVT